MRRSLIILLGLCFALGAQSANAATLGISDQQATTFTNTLYKPLKLKAARYIAPYDVTSDATQRERFVAWYGAALLAKQRLLVSFEHSRTKGKEKKAPSARVYEKATKAFKKSFPKVREINTWNEINRCQTGSRTEGQPRKLCSVKTGPKLLQSYYKSNRKIFKGSKYKIVPLNVLDERNPGKAVQYVKAFKRIAKPAPKIWGIHNYSDTNRFSSSRTKKIIKAIGPRGEVWLLETGGIVRLGKSLPFSTKRAARALGCMFTIAKKIKRVKRLYIYQFNGAAPGASFDAGLIGSDGTKRPGYNVVKRRKASPCTGK
jgi:hypothetical protein